MAAKHVTQLYLSAWRKRKGLTQEQLANILNVTKSTVSRWEKGVRHIDMADLQRIAEAFGVDPVALFLAPEDIDSARAIHRFTALLKEIGLERAQALLDGAGAPKDEAKQKNAP